MEFLIPIVLFVMLFTTIQKIAAMRHERNLKQIEASRPHQLPKPEELKMLAAEKSELEERVRNLEAIVCSVDFELNAKINRVASRHMAVQGATPAGTTERMEPAATEQFAGVKLVTGKRLGNRWVIQRPLGQGGMGAVFLARDEQLREDVAIKVIGGLAALDPNATDRLRREASAARRISHPNVVRLHDMGEAEGLLFLSMEYVPGGSLRDMLDRHGVLTPQQLRPLAQQLCEGLHAAHMAGIVHRDLKPANLLIDEHQRLKIIDFGLARMAHLEGMTATNMIAGTVEYMAPEQIRGGLIDPRTDLYAVGALLFHALVGRPPFAGGNPIAVGFAHCTEPVPVPSVARVGLEPTWDAVVVRAMAKDPGQRWQSALELRDALPV